MAARSEHDVVVAWPGLVIVVEVKHTSDNPIEADHKAFDNYLDGL